jgi:hypothetical protein
MFYGCKGIKLSGTQSDEYSTPYRIPTTGTGKTATRALTEMFGLTGSGNIGNGTVTINTTYYLPAVQTFTSFALPASLTLIGENAFEGIAAQRVDVSESVVSIEKRAFADCKNLREIHIPAMVKSIDDTALAGCENVTVYGTTGSEAWRFANDAGFNFVDLNGGQ